MVRSSICSCGSTQRLTVPTRFSDVAHELKPVSSGRRLVLTYNLIHSNLGPDVLSAGSNRSMAKIETLFSYWNDNLKEEPSRLYFLLEDRLHDENLSYDGLKGDDLQVVKHLRDAGRNTGSAYT